MLDFLKRFGLGILYIIAAPFLLVFLLLWMIYALIIFIIEIIKGIRNYFHGKNFFPDFEEDVEAKRILNASNPINDATIPINAIPATSSAERITEPTDE